MSLMRLFDMNLASTPLKLLLIAVISLSNASIKQVGPDDHWQQYNTFGQLSAVSTDSKGNVYVFHRGDRKWDSFSFDSNERFTKSALGPIKQPTIIVLSPNGSLLTSSGTDLFYLPHGITVDFEQNIWVTDVALHQVMKFPPLDLSLEKTPMPLATLTLGEALVPGHDSDHFCKPTSVAVDSRTGDFFVADGYCNSRIIKYNKSGYRILQWGKASPFRAKLGLYSLSVPHSLAIDERHQRLIVADRENSRVLCFNMSDGKFVHQLQFNNHVYAVAFSNKQDSLLVVTGLANGVGTVINAESWTALAEFRPEKWFDGAHDIAVSPDGRFAYAVELTENIVWRFTVGVNLTADKGESESELQKISVNTVPKIGKTVSHALPVNTVDSETGGSDGLPIESFPSDRDLTDNAMTYLNANQVAVSFVTAVILFGFVAVIVHLRKRGASASHEMRGLIHHEDE